MKLFWKERQAEILSLALTLPIELRIWVYIHLLALLPSSEIAVPHIKLSRQHLSTVLSTEHWTTGSNLYLGKFCCRYPNFLPKLDIRFVAYKRYVFISSKWLLKEKITCFKLLCDNGIKKIFFLLH